MISVIVPSDSRADPVEVDPVQWVDVDCTPLEGRHAHERHDDHGASYLGRIQHPGQPDGGFDARVFRAVDTAVTRIPARPPCR